MLYRGFLAVLYAINCLIFLFDPKVTAFESLMAIGFGLLLWSVASFPDKS